MGEGSLIKSRDLSKAATSPENPLQHGQHVPNSATLEFSMQPEALQWLSPDLQKLLTPLQTVGGEPWASFRLVSSQACDLCFSPACPPGESVCSEGVLPFYSYVPFTE